MVPKTIPNNFQSNNAAFLWSGDKAYRGLCPRLFGPIKRHANPEHPYPESLAVSIPTTRLQTYINLLD